MTRTSTSTDPDTRIDGDLEARAEHSDLARSEGGTSSAHESEAAPGAAADASTGTRSPDDIKYDLIATLKTVYDPEIPVDIYELGLIYEAEVGEAGEVTIVMTLTSPMCPVAEILPPEVEAKAREVEGVTKVDLQLVWEPPWSMDMMSAAARLELNI